VCCGSPVSRSLSTSLSLPDWGAQPPPTCDISVSSQLNRGSKFRKKIIRLKQDGKGMRSITISSATPDTASSFSWVHLATGLARFVGVYHNSCQSPLQLGLFISECLRSPQQYRGAVPRFCATSNLCPYGKHKRWKLSAPSGVQWRRRSDGLMTVSLVVPLWPDIAA
jgi:hypothetical protein